MRASFRGYCSACDQPIEIDQEITLTADLEWEHTVCPLGADPLAVSGSVCPRCSCYHRGEC